MLKCHQFVPSLWALYRLVVSSITFVQVCLTLGVQKLLYSSFCFVFFFLQSPCPSVTFGLFPPLLCLCQLQLTSLSSLSSFVHGGVWRSPCYIVIFPKEHVLRNGNKCACVSILKISYFQVIVITIKNMGLCLGSCLIILKI